ncbi:hypothetical protein LOK49_LG09G00353 [Camellia lanceoleosa]|uniref:Uncharacterized protein n=1 Tax=Camellia lanceoleosa TaxID=1840588 RepID=A0ACC0GNK5_9ERIC|nr:hypothetical protein LOK49_LG09G00353 [Camellia lanceoleosa]
MILVKAATGPRRRILFLGGRSFEFEEVVADHRGHRQLSIVERGQGLRREVVLLGFEVQWTARKLRTESCMSDRHSFSGRLEGKGQSVATWLRDEDNGGFSVQIVVTSKGKRTQIYLPMLEFGDRWEGVALVIEGFAIGPEGGSKRGEDKGVMIEKRVVPKPGGTIGPIGGVKVVNGVAEEGWFQYLDRAVVGKVGLRGDKGVGFLAMTEWVGRWWKEFGKVKIRPIRGQDFLFVLPT